MVWEESKVGKLILALEAVSLESNDKVLRQIVNMSLITPRFWSEGPFQGHQRLVGEQNNTKNA